MKLTAIKKELIKEAKERYGSIKPVRRINRSFSEYEGVLYFWYNDINGSTHVTKQIMNN